MLRKPSLLHVSEARLRCKDGNFKLGDGKHTFAALAELKKMFEVLAAGEQEALGHTEMLVHALTVGVDVAVLVCEDWGEDLSFAWAFSTHDAENNRYKPSSLKELVAVARRHKAKVPGGGWQGTQALLLGVCGEGRRMCVFLRPQDLFCFA